MSDRVFRTALGTVAVVGVAVRILYVTRVHAGVEFGDAETYRLLGELLADGEGYIRPREFLLMGERIPTAEFPPLWPMLLGVLDLVGFDGANEQRAFGALLGGATIVVVGLLAAALADRRAGVVAAMLTAGYPQFIVLDTALLAEGLMILLVATALLGLVRARGATGGVLGAVVVDGGCSPVRRSVWLPSPGRRRWYSRSCSSCPPVGRSIDGHGLERWRSGSPVSSSASVVGPCATP